MSGFLSARENRSLDRRHSRLVEPVLKRPRTARRADCGLRYEGYFRRRKTLLGSGWGRLLAPVPVTQCREQKDCRHAGQTASDKENAVGVNEAVRGAQAFDGNTGKPLQDLSQPGIG